MSNALVRKGDPIELRVYRDIWVPGRVGIVDASCFDAEDDEGNLWGLDIEDVGLSWRPVGVGPVRGGPDEGEGEQKRENVHEGDRDVAGPTAGLPGPARRPETDDLVFLRDGHGAWEGPFPVGRVWLDGFWVWTAIRPRPAGAFRAFVDPSWAPGPAEGAAPRG